uniref:Cyclic GMP-AMP synthase n=1 Tax=Salarias fasciatus TaxID=181472 RepID=A0A672I0V0_SALFA
MSGRGRPRKATGPTAQNTNKKSTDEGNGEQQNGRKTPEETQNGTTREQKPKKRETKEPRHSTERPSVQDRKEEKTNQCTAGLNEQGLASRGARGKTCAGRATPSQATPPVQPDMPEGLQAGCVNTRRQRKCNGIAKSQEGPADEPQEPSESIMKPKQNGRKARAAENLTEEMTKLQPETSRAKPHAGKLNGIKVEPEQLQEGDLQKTGSKKDKIKADMMPEAPQKASKARAANGSDKEATERATKTKKTPEESSQSEETKAMNSFLNNTLETLKIKKDDKSKTAKVVNEIIKNIVLHLKLCFFSIGVFIVTDLCPQISSPDEFDVMIPLLVERVEITPFGEDGAFYSVGLKRGSNPLRKFQEGETLSASEMLSEFRDEVKKCVKQFKEWTLDKKKAGCPAVTLSTTVQSVTISLDVVLCLMVKSNWPSFAKDGLNVKHWLGTKFKREFKFQPYYLVPKYEGRNTWRISFSHIEKAILKSHGSEKTCCEEGGVRCCRKACLKLLKHLLSQLKEEDPSFDKFCSYHAKTTLLHACCSRPRDGDWRLSDLSHCFQMLLQDFQAHLRRGILQNFFIPSQNLYLSTLHSSFPFASQVLWGNFTSVDLELSCYLFTLVWGH